MKKMFLNFVIILTILLTSTTSLAVAEPSSESASGESEDNEVYIDSYDEYMNAISDMDEQDYYKEYYMQYIAEQIESYDSSKRDETVKARVVDVKSTEEYYSYDNYGLYKIKYQPLQIEILEGEHTGETYELSYILTVDTYENIDVKPVKENQIINVILYEENGEVYPYSTTVDSSISRVKCIIVLAIITLVLVFVYLGKKGFKVLPQLILLADVILLIFVPELLTGRSIIWLTIITMILYLVVDTAIKVGVNGKMVVAIMSTFAVVLITTILMEIFNGVATMSGIIYEATTIIEAFPKGTINFYTLNLAIYILMATIIASDIACKAINTYDDNKKEETRGEIKEYVIAKLPTIIGILLITVIPKYLYMLVSKYTFTEIINSEMLTNEIARMLFLIISTLVTTEVAIYAKKMFMKK